MRHVYRLYRKLALPVIALLVMVGGLAVFSQPVKADSYPCNVVRTTYGNSSGIILHAADWAGSLGSQPQLDVYSNNDGSTSRYNCANGSWIGTDTWGLEMQCTEFAVRVADFEWHTGGFSVWSSAHPPGQGSWTGAAKDMFRVAPYLSTLALQAIPNNSGSLPQLGDILVIGDTSVGHVGIVQQVSGGRLSLVGENQGDAISTQITYSGTNFNSSNFISNSWVIGWIHGPTATPPSPFNPRYVTNLYHDILNRVGSTSEVNTWVNALNQGSSRSQVVNSFLTSTEYRTNLVAANFQQMLHRAVDPSGSTTFVNLLSNGAKNEDVLVNLAASDEYFSNRGGGTNTGYVNALYQDLLQRAVDSSGLAYWTQQLNNGAQRADVAHALVTSQEYRTNLVNAYYVHYLGRSADQSGLNNFVTILNNGGTDESVIAGLVTSVEYYGKQ